jgi:hypothetical protein
MYNLPSQGLHPWPKNIKRHVCLQMIQASQKFL